MSEMSETGGRSFVCIQCPNGCRITVANEGGKTVVHGASCVKGESFALKESTHPMRSLTTTVKTAFPASPRLPVRTLGELPRESVRAAVLELKKYVQTTPVKCGDVIIDDLFGCRVAATDDLEVK